MSTSRYAALWACHQAGERLGEMARDFYGEDSSRREDSDYLLPRIESLLDYTDATARENDDLKEANRILADTVDTLIEALLDALEVGRG